MSLIQRALVSVEVDQFIQDKDEHYWFITLNDGTVVYEDDDRPEHEEKSAWKRLKTFCDLNKLYIVQVGLRFRSHIVTIDTADWDGVFFIKSLLGFIRIHDGKGAPPVMRFPNRYYYNIGRVQGDKIQVQKWEMPAIVLDEDYIRDNGPDEKNLTIYKHA